MRRRARDVDDNAVDRLPSPPVVVGGRRHNTGDAGVFGRGQRPRAVAERRRLRRDGIVEHRLLDSHRLGIDFEGAGPGPAVSLLRGRSRPGGGRDTRAFAGRLEGGQRTEAVVVGHIRRSRRSRRCRARRRSRAHGGCGFSGSDGGRGRRCARLRAVARPFQDQLGAACAIARAIAQREHPHPAQGAVAEPGQRDIGTLRGRCVFHPPIGGSRRRCRREAEIEPVRSDEARQHVRPHDIDGLAPGNGEQTVFAA